MRPKITRILVLLSLPFLLSETADDRNTIRELDSGKPSGTAIIITGAAAKIPQQAAILEQMHITGRLNRVVFISGVSSGALNAVMMNAILNGRYTWKQYRNLLFSMTNQKVFVHTDKPLPVSTEPLRQLLKTVLNDTIGYRIMADLPVSTSLSVVSLQIRGFANRTYRLSNIRINKESDPGLDIVDVLMASTAFPVVFPPVTINNNGTIPDSRYIDGGAGDDYLPYRAVIDFEKYRGYPVERVYIVGRKMGNDETFAQELKEMGIERYDWFSKVGLSLEDIEKNALYKRFDNLKKEAPLLASKTSVLIPDFSENYTMFDFNNLYEQYASARKWARANRPVPLNDFIKNNLIK